MSKVIIRVATKDQYCYIEEEVADTSPEAIKARYNELFSLMNTSQRIPEERFYNMIIGIMNSDLTEWQMDADTYANDLTDIQKSVIQSIKRFKKRLPEE